MGIGVMVETVIGMSVEINGRPVGWIGIGSVTRIGIGKGGGMGIGMDAERMGGRSSGSRTGAARPRCITKIIFLTI